MHSAPVARVRGALGATACALALNAWAAQPLYIGQLFAIERPPGFTVEDARPQAMRADDSNVNVPPVDLLAEALVNAKGDALSGKKLVVQEFSFTTEDKRGFVNLGSPDMRSPTPLLGALAVASGVSLLKSIQKTGSRLDVTIVASLDGRTFEGRGSGHIPPNDDRGTAETIVHAAIRSFIYNLSQAGSNPVPEEAPLVLPALPALPPQNVPDAAPH
jgi:hypothetical protein